MTIAEGTDDTQSELQGIVTACRAALISVGIATALVNILMLTGSFFMLQVYDRVLPSGSVPTLVTLALLCLLLFAFQGVLDVLRSRILVRVSASLDERLSPRVFDILVRLPLLRRASAEALQPLRDLDQVRSFLSGSGPLALFDLPWIPLYLAVCFAFHFWIGITALVGALLLVALTLATEALTRKPAKASLVFSAIRSSFAEASRRNSEVLAAMGMTPEIARIWHEANRKYLAANERVSDVAGGLGAVSKVFRLVLQSAVLGVGAYLVIHGEASAGVIIAGSILSARALAPVDLAIANWRGFVAARQSWTRLSELLKSMPPREASIELPAPTKSFKVQDVHVAPPTATRLTVKGVSFALPSGSGLGIIGPSASGKSTLARALVGIWRPVRGTIRLDGASLEHWAPEHLGRHIGYLPQDIELFDGTIAQNIARFRPQADSQAVLKAAQMAGVHEMILAMPDGYETRIGDGGAALSAGQRQRVGLARALYGDPFLVVLDEPNSNLDAEGEAALQEAILGVRARQGIVVLIAHRPSSLAAVDHLLVMGEGEPKAFGPRDEVLRGRVRSVGAAVAPVPQAVGTGG